LQEKIRNCINKLDSIALKSGVLDGSDDYIDLMIISEESEKKLGYKARISSLKDLKNEYKFLREIYEGSSVTQSFEEFIIEQFAGVGEMSKKPSMFGNFLKKFIK
jgi:hypothetical protein